MPVASIIIETENGACDAVLASLARMDNVSVYGIMGNQIVTVVENDSAQTLEQSVAMLVAIEQVVGVYPVFSGMYG
jgi:nitrate reductase NapAB chaperone NapD